MAGDGCSSGIRPRNGLASPGAVRIVDATRVAALFKELLVELGEDPEREGLRKTPQRVAKALAYLTRGYRQSRASVVNKAIFTAETDQMVVVKDIEVYSLSEQNLMPFYGKCHVGYIAQGKVLGVSKVARIVDMYARRLQIQERLTEEIARAIHEETGAQGVAVVMECKHLCMMMRGVEKQNSVMTTSAVRGSLRTSAQTRQEFMSLIAGEDK